MPVCQRCARPFPNRKFIGGKQRVLNTRRYCLRCSPFGTHNTRPLFATRRTDPHKRKRPKCSLCKKAKPEFERRYRAKCSACYLRQRKLALKQRAVEHKGGECLSCGYKRSLRALAFHHLDPQKKEYSVSKHPNYGWSRLRLEIEKCILLCAVCHIEVHEGLQDEGALRAKEMARLKVFDNPVYT